MLTQKELQSVLNYDQDTGIFTWKVISKFHNEKIDNIAGSKNSNKYISIQINKQLYKAHRLAWLYVYGKFPNNIIDHINCNKSDNRIANLREANRIQNGYNRKTNKNSLSGIKGVSWNDRDKKWQARITVNKKVKSLGYFDNLDDARIAIEYARRTYHKQFANNGE